MKRAVRKAIFVMTAVAAVMACTSFAFATNLKSSGSSSTTMSTGAAVTSSAATGAPNGVSGDIAMTLVVDTSGSMSEASALSGKSKLAAAQKQSTDFVSSVKKQGGQGGASVKVGVVSFANNSSVISPLSSDPNSIVSAISAMRASGGTNMYAGLNEGIEQLLADPSSVKMMVYLSDGMNNSGHSGDEIRALADKAASKGIVIYTIGYGYARDLDESLLQYIAKATGGEYAHEDTSDLGQAAVGLFRVMQKAQIQASGEQILLDEIGSVQQGQTVDVGTAETTQDGTLTAYLYWPGSDLGLNLTDPDGTQVTEGYSGYTIDDSAIPVKVQVQNAKTGTWKMSVTGKQVSMPSEPFYAVSSFAKSVVTGGGGAAPDGSMIFLFMFGILLVVCLLGTYAFSKRRTS